MGFCTKNVPPFISAHDVFTKPEEQRRAADREKELVGRANNGDAPVQEARAEDGKRPRDESAPTSDR